MWSPKCEDSFQQLKQLLTNAPVLNIAYPKKDFLVFIDSCKEGLDGVIMKEGQVVCYESQKLKKHEKKYVTHDLELAAIFHALKMWRHYLLGRIFILMIYHYGLKYLFDQPRLNARHDRCMALISEVDFEIKHIKGKESKVVNTLSQSIHTIHLAAASVGDSNIP
jgi:hypothetical protein